MNKRQKIILLVYAGVVAAMVLFPPFVVEFRGNVLKSEYSLIWEPIWVDQELLWLIDLARLLAQLLGASLVAGALLLASGDKA